MIQTFRYLARTTDGSRIDGTIAAEGVIAVADHLRARGLIAVRITIDQQGIIRWVREGDFGSHEVALMVFFRSLAILIEAGITLRSALEIVGDEITDQRLKETVASMRVAVDGGCSFAAAMEMHERIFSLLAIALVGAAEQSGQLSESLARYATMLEQQRSLKRKIFSAMLYPVIVLLAAIALLVTMMLVIMPTLASLFAQMNVEIPVQVRVSIAVGAWLSNGGWLWTMLALLGSSCAVAYTFQRKGFQKFDALRLRMPIFGRFLRRAIVARWARLLASLLGAGISIVPALEATMPALASPVYVAEIKRVAHRLEDGGTISEGLRQSPWFESLAVHLVSIGEETGRLDANLSRLGELYERDLVEELAAVVALIEPLIILVVGGIVGAVVLSIFIPLYSLIGNVR